jgi:hypothetical protein
MDGMDSVSYKNPFYDLILLKVSNTVWSLGTFLTREPLYWVNIFNQTINTLSTFFSIHDHSFHMAYTPTHKHNVNVVAYLR